MIKYAIAVVFLSSCLAYDDFDIDIGRFRASSQVRRDSSQLEITIKTIAGKFLGYAIKAAFGQNEQIIISDNKGNETECDLIWKWRLHSWEFVFDVTVTCPTPAQTAEATIRGRKSRTGAIVDAICQVTGQIYGAGITVNFGDKIRSCTA